MKRKNDYPSVPVDLNEHFEISRQYPPTPLMGVGAIVIEEGRILLVQRGKEPSFGEWSVPGGMVKLGETLDHAVAREVLEETGLHVEPVILVELLERIFLDDLGKVQYHYVLADYLCHVVEGTLVPNSDALDAQWVLADDLNKFRVAPVTVKVILKALEMRS